MQTAVIDTIFGEFKRNFDHFFTNCEQGFINELIINMYCRTYEPNTDVIIYQQRFSEIFFINQGGVRMFNRY
jgi:hypothetical protein